MKLTPICSLVFSIILLPGCATVFTGYYNNVELKDAPDSLRVFTQEGVEIPVERITISGTSAEYDSVYESRPNARIRLRSNLDPVLVLRHGNQEKKVQVFGKIQAGWLLLDAIFGTSLVLDAIRGKTIRAEWLFVDAISMIVDAVTGNWNSYDAIDAGFK